MQLDSPCPLPSNPDENPIISVCNKEQLRSTDHLMVACTKINTLTVNV